MKPGIGHRASGNGKAASLLDRGRIYARSLFCDAEFGFDDEAVASAYVAGYKAAAGKYGTVEIGEAVRLRKRLAEAEARHSGELIAAELRGMEMAAARLLESAGGARRSSDG